MQTDMKVDDKVVPRNPVGNFMVPCTVLEVADLGHGEGKERVKIMLPPLGLTRYYAKEELQLLEEWLTE